MADPYLSRTAPMRVGGRSGWEESKSSEWLDPTFAARLERRHNELKKLIETECMNGNKYMISMKKKYEKEVRRKEKNHKRYMKKLEEMSQSKKKERTKEPKPSWMLRWDEKHQQILWEKFIEYCNIGQSRTSTKELMNGSRFFSFARHCGFVDEVRPSKIISTIRQKARESRRRHKIRATPAELIEKKRAHTGPAVTPATMDLLFTKVHRKNRYKHRVIDFDGFCEMVERIALEIWQEDPAICRRKAIGVIEQVKVILTGTKGKANKFHDDLNLYTGSYKQRLMPNGGAPSPRNITLCNMMDRSPANVRGVNLHYSQHKLAPFPIRRRLC